MVKIGNGELMTVTICCLEDEFCWRLLEYEKDRGEKKLYSMRVLRAKAYQNIRNILYVKSVLRSKKKGGLAP